MRRALVLALVMALVGAGCGGNEKKEKTGGSATPTSAPGERVTVLMDGKASNYNGVFTARFPAEVKVHPGATVDFKMPHFPGDPHTVTLGTLVDAGVKKLEALGPTASFADQENTAELINLPDVFPHEGLQERDLNQSAALPCYLDSGVPPLSLSGGAPPCPKRDQPEFNGRQSFYNSGALVGDNVSFPVKLSADIAPGTYGIFCLIHRGGMFSKLTVADMATSLPSASEVATKADAEFKELAARLEPAAKEPAGQPGGTVLAGALASGVFNATVAQFMPANITIAAGQSVTWQWFYAHTVSFNVPPEAKQFLMPAADGTLHPNPKVFAPANSPPLPPAYQAFPPSPLAVKATTPYLVDGGSFDGTAYKNSGFIVSIPFLPAIVSYKVTFTKPGTYSYVCILHPAMGGSVKVT